MVDVAASRTPELIGGTAPAEGPASPGHPHPQPSAPSLTSTFPEQSGNLGSLGASHWSRRPSDTAGREGQLAEDLGPGKSPAEKAQGRWEGGAWEYTLPLT